MNAHTFPMPVIPAAVERQETCDRFGGTCCSWACCKAPMKHRAEPVRLLPAGDLVIDLDIPDSDYTGASPLAVFAANAERKRAAVSPYDNDEAGWW